MGMRQQIVGCLGWLQEEDLRKHVRIVKNKQANVETIIVGIITLLRRCRKVYKSVPIQNTKVKLLSEACGS